MITSRTRSAAVALLTAPLLAACSTSFGAQTDRVYTPARGVNNRTGEVYILNLLVVSPEDGKGGVIATLVNTDQEDDDTLVDVTVGGSTAQFTPAVQNATIPAFGPLNLATSGGVTATGDDIVAGRFIDVTFSFQNGRQITMNAPVIPQTGIYTDIPIKFPTTGDAKVTEQADDEDAAAESDSADESSEDEEE